jgi:hypothetical protein
MIKPAYVGIDPSLNSTAVCIELTDGTEFYLNYTTATKHSQWMKRTTDCVYYSLEAYSEIVKVKEYGKLAVKIGSKIAERASGAQVTYDGLQDVQVAMEGYSYGSSAGPLIDLVTFGSALRRNVLERGAKLEVVSPMSLKVFACTQTYGLDKKGIARNDIGLAGGKFTKHEMYRAINDGKTPCVLAEKVKEWQADIYGMKNVPKPLDDLFDAWHLKEYAKRIAQGHKLPETPAE